MKAQRIISPVDAVGEVSGPRAVSPWAIVRAVSIVGAILALFIADPRVFGATTAVLITLVAAALAAGVALLLGYRRQKTPLDYPLLGFVAWSLVAATYGLLRGNQGHLIAGDMFQIFELAGFFFLVTGTVRSRQDLYLVLIFGLVAFLAYTAWQLDAFYTGNSLYGLNLGEARVGRTLATGSALVFLGLFTFLLFRRAQTSWALGGLLLFLAYGLFLSFSRALWLGVVAGAVIPMFIKFSSVPKHGIRLETIMSLTLLALIALIVFGMWQPMWVMDRFEQGVQRISYTAVYLEEDASPLQRSRILELESAGSEIRNNPIIGIGLGGTYFSYGAKTSSRFDPNYTQAGFDFGGKHYIHNSFVQVALRLGIIGLLLWVWLLWAYFRSCARFYRAASQQLHKGFLMAYLSMIIAACVASLFNPLLFRHPEAALIGVILGLTFVTQTLFAQPVNQR